MSRDSDPTRPDRPRPPARETHAETESETLGDLVAEALDESFAATMTSFEGDEVSGELESGVAGLVGRVAALAPAAQPPAALAPAIGRGTLVADHYEVLRLLGQGGMGAVYLARDLRLGRQVVVKVILTRGLQAEQLRLFEREARATAQLRHPAVVTIHAYGAWQEMPYMVLEYLEGESLEATLRRGPLPELEACRILHEVARGLGAAHAAGLVHRDLKPANIHLQPDGQPRILDFGIVEFDLERAAELADALRSTDAGNTEALLRPGPRMAGTPVYMAPEQVRGQAQGPQVDVWAAGITLCEMVTGTRPVRAVDDTVSRKPLDLGALREHARPELVAVAAQALAKDPASRFPDGNALADALAAILQAQTATSLDGEPYRFLAPFDEHASGWFFGREAETARAVQHLREHPVLAIVGPSGSGKSSLVLAGVVPRLRRSFDQEAVSLRPGARPLHALLAAVRALPGAAPDLAALTPDALREAPGRFGAELRRHAEAHAVGLLLVVDQTEELFTHDAVSAAERECFARALLSAADDPDTPVRLVLTLREDFLSRLTTLPELARAVTTGLVCLGRPPRDALVRAVREPARRAGVAVEPRLVDALVDAVAEETAPLPLLQVAMSRVWARRSGDMLALRTLEEIGGVAGVLAEHAENTLDGLLDPRDIQAARTVLTELVAPGSHTRQRRSRDDLDAAVGDPERSERVVAHLARHALVALHEDEGVVQVDLAHESLIERWDRLQRWLDDSDDDRAWSQRLAAAAAHWHERDSAASLLWSGAALREAEARLAATPERFAPLERAFVETAGRREARARRLRSLALVAAVLLSATVAAASFWGYTIATEARAEAEAATDLATEQRALADTAAERARQAWREARSRELASASRDTLAHDPVLALLLAREATTLARTPDALGALHHALLDSRERARLQHDDPALALRDLQTTPDGQHLLSVAASDTHAEARLWSRSGKPLATLGPWPRDAAPALRLADDGTVLAFGPAGATRHERDGVASQLLVDQPVSALDVRGTALALATPDGLYVGELAEGSDARLVRLDWPEGLAREARRVELVGEDRVLVVVARDEAADGGEEAVVLATDRGALLARVQGAEVTVDGTRRHLLVARPDGGGLDVLRVDDAAPVAAYSFADPRPNIAARRFVAETHGPRLLVPDAQAPGVFRIVTPGSAIEPRARFELGGWAPQAWFALDDQVLVAASPEKDVPLRVFGTDPLALGAAEPRPLATLDPRSTWRRATVSTDADARWLFFGAAGDEQVEVFGVEGRAHGALAVGAFVDEIAWLGDSGPGSETLVAVRSRDALRLFALEPAERPSLPPPRQPAPARAEARLQTEARSAIVALAWSPDGRELLATSAALQSRPVVLADLGNLVATAPQLRRMRADDGELLETRAGTRALLRAPDGSRLVLEEENGRVALLEAAVGNEVAELLAAAPSMTRRRSLHWGGEPQSPNLLVLERSLSSAQVKVFDRDGASLLARDLGEDFRDAALQPGRARLALVHASGLTLESLDGGPPAAALRFAESQRAWRAAWLPDGSALSVQLSGGRALLWWPDSGRTLEWTPAGSELVVLPAAPALAPSARFASWNRTEAQVSLHDTEGRVVHELAAGAAVRGLVLAGDGQALALLADDGVHLWLGAGRSGAIVVPGDVLAVAFHPREPRIALGLGDGSVRQLELDPTALLEIATARTTRPLSEREQRTWRLGAWSEQP